MRYFKLNGDVYAYPVDGSQEEFIKDGAVLMTDDELDRHKNPEKYLSAD